MSYEHLTLEQRYQIAALHSAGSSNKCIAEEIGCHPSTIGRELRRNCSGKAVYVGSIAHRKRCQGQFLTGTIPHPRPASRMMLTGGMR